MVTTYTFILRRYSQELKCGKQCLDNNLKAATATLCLSLILFQVFPHALEKVAEMYFNNYTQEESKGYGSALSMLVIVVKIDNVYTLTITVLMTETEDFCTLGWILVSICSAAGVIIITIYCVHAVKTLDRHQKVNSYMHIFLATRVSSSIFTSRQPTALRLCLKMQYSPS